MRQMVLAFLGGLALLSLTAGNLANAEGKENWYEQQELTPEAQTLYSTWFKSCCDHGDAFKTRFRSAENDGSLWGKEHWQYWKDGQWLDVPPEIVHHGPTPDGQPVLFLYSYHDNPIPFGAPLCFIIDGAGI